MELPNVNHVEKRGKNLAAGQSLPPIPYVNKGESTAKISSSRGMMVSSRKSMLMSTERAESRPQKNKSETQSPFIKAFQAIIVLISRRAAKEKTEDYIAQFFRGQKVYSKLSSKFRIVKIIRNYRSVKFEQGQYEFSLTTTPKTDGFMRIRVVRI